MITEAKVSLASVKAFNQAVGEARDYSSRFDRGITCMDQLLNYLSELVTGLREKTADMQIAREKLAMIIKSIEEIIARLTVQLNDLRERLSELEDKLSGMDAYITVANKDGSVYEIPNPAYAALETRISVLEGKISMVENELYTQQQRLERANSVDSHLNSHIDVVNGVIYSLEEKMRKCRQLRTELEDVKFSNSKKSSSAAETLKRIEQIVAGYLRIKMIYEVVTDSDNVTPTQSFREININVNINKTTVVNESEVAPEMETEQDELCEEEIERRQNKYDTDEHICEYDGKFFGGKYNSYEERIKFASKDDPLVGKYAGIRGESKFVPSNRTAEGIVVIGILSEYDLDGIEYRNGEPDFEVCSEAVVAIAAMTENRENYIDNNRVQQLGNFVQADIKLAEMWNSDKRDGRDNWEVRDVYYYRKENGLSWHEKCDRETMVLVKREINAYFRHLGGCSECRLRDAGGDEGGGFDE